MDFFLSNMELVFKELLILMIKLFIKMLNGIFILIVLIQSTYGNLHHYSCHLFKSKACPVWLDLI